VNTAVLDALRSLSDIAGHP